MVFVTLICLVVAAYFLWDALKDKKNAEAGNSLSTAHRISSAKTGDYAPANYKNTRTPIASSGKQGSAGSHSSSTAAARTAGAPASNNQASGPSAAVQSAAARPVGGQAGANAAATAAKSDGSSRDASSTAAAAKAAVAEKRQSANDANVNPGAVAGAAATAAAGLAAGAVAGSAAGRGANGGLRFLDGPIGRKDDLTRIDGVGPVIEEGLNNIGIFHFHQIANFTDNDIRNVDTELDFPGRIAREGWVEQARKLSSISLEQSSLDSADVHLDSVVSIDEHAPGIDRPDSVLTDADYTGVWNTDVMIEIQERLKVLNTRISDAPRMRMTRDEYTAIKASEDALFSRDRLLEILDRLRELD